jgi:uncharacterized protein YkwD
VRVASPVRCLLVVAALASAGALLPAQARPAGRTGAAASVASLQSGVLAQVNQIRVAHGLAPLRLNSALSAAARQHSAEMLAHGYFAHESADGSAFWKRIQRYYPSAHYESWSVGENLLWEGGSLDANAALGLWMASPEHRANILSVDWHEIGIAALYEPSASGVFHGSPVTIVATDFGARS